MSGIRAVLFDFGGVLAEEGFRNTLEALAREQQLPVRDMTAEGAQAVYDSGFVLGRGDAAAFWSLLRRRTGLRGEDAALTAAVLNGFVPRPWMLQLVERLRCLGYVTGILSDQTDWLDLLDERHGFFRHFDRVYNSYHLGKGKRDPALFLEVADDLGVAPGAVLFVDDDPGNVARAATAGMRAVRYTDRAALVADLEACLDKRLAPL